MCIFLSSIILPILPRVLIINEYCSKNNTGIQDDNGQYSDWIEIKNISTGTLSLRNFCLSDNYTDLHKWRFPTGASLAAGQIVLVFAKSEDHADYAGGDYYASFAIDAEGSEPLILSQYTSLAIEDQSQPTALEADVSYGHISNGTSWFYFIEPTPRAENTTQGYSALLDEPIATQNSGWYPDSLGVNFTPPTTGVQIRYTTDGSDPKADSPLWPGLKYLHNRSSEPNVISLISTVLPDLPPPVNELDFWYPPADNVTKIHTIKTRSFAAGALPSKTVTRSYLVGINLYEFPIVTLAIDPHDLFDPDDGIYIAGNGYDGNWLHANFYQDWGRKVVAEWFDSLGSPFYQQQFEVEIHGRYSCRAGQKSLRLKAAAMDGDLSLNYPFFGPDYLDHFYNLILRNSGNDVHWTMFRDNFVQTLLKEQGLDTANFKPYMVFLNGEYWGIHILQEHPQEHYVANHYNIPLTELDVLERDSDTLLGSDTDYDAMLAYINTHDETDPGVWQYLNTKVDMNNFSEYMAGEIYAGNTDWPGNNIRYWRKRVSYTPNAPYGHDGRYRWLVYDTDFSFGFYQTPTWMHNTLWSALDPAREWRTFLLRNFTTNPDFKNNLLNIFADRLNYNWQPAKVINLINQFESRYAASMPLHIARWSLPVSYSRWLENVDDLRVFANNRPDYLRGLLVAQFGLAGTAAVNLQITPPEAGVIRVNNRVDLAAGVYTYFQGVPVSMKAVLNPGWEVLSFGGQPTDSLAFNPVATQNILLIAQMQVPKNLSIRKEGTNLLLSWDDIPDADGYSVEFAASPYAETWDAIPSDSNQLIISEPGEMLFYRVKAVFE
jgi:hypothetical protein